MEIININGEIGWEVDPSDVKSQLEKAAGKDIDVHVASPGGSVFRGIEIYNMFRDYKRKNPDCQMMLTIKGLAASMASYLSVNPAFDLVAAEDNAVFMIHNASGGVMGDYRDMLKMAEVLEGLTDMLGEAYTAKTKTPKKKIREMMDAETWLFGREILDAGFIDEIIPTKKDDDKATALSGARVQFKAVSEKIKNESLDYGQIAAMIKSDYQPENPVNNKNQPAQMREKMEVAMSLKQFIAENPAAKQELEEMLKAEFEAGKKTMQAAVSAAAKFLGADSVYPAPIKSLAIDVLNGKVTVEALNVTVTAFDAMSEAAKSVQAKAETETTGATPGQQTGLSGNGEIKTAQDVSAQIKADRIALGMEVK